MTDDRSPVTGLTDLEERVYRLRELGVGWIEIAYQLHLTSWVIRQLHQHAVAVMANTKR